MFSNEALAQRRNHFKIVFYVLVFFLSNHTSPLTRVLFLSPSNTFPLPCNTCMLFATNTCRHSTLSSLSLLPWLPPPTYSPRSPLWHAKTGAHLQQNKFHTMLKYECPLKCTWALPLVLTSSNRWHVYGNIKSSNPSSFHRLPTVHGLSVCICSLLILPPAPSPSAPLLKSKPSAEEWACLRSGSCVVPL